ncbi:MAG TPA: hypothetical protein VGO62_03005, partial [Myxococcota bacterium]
MTQALEAFQEALTGGADDDALDVAAADVRRDDGAAALVEAIKMRIAHDLGNGKTDLDVTALRFRLASALEEVAKVGAAGAAAAALEAAQLCREVLNDGEGTTRNLLLAIRAGVNDDATLKRAVETAGGREQAEHVVERALKKPEVKEDPVATATLRRALARIAENAGDKERAFFEAMKAARKQPADGMYVDEVFRLALDTARHTEAAAFFSALADDTGLAERQRATLYNKLGQTLEKSNEKARALDAYTKSLRLHDAKAPRRAVERLTEELGVEAAGAVSEGAFSPIKPNEPVDVTPPFDHKTGMVSTVQDEPVLPSLPSPSPSELTQPRVPANFRTAELAEGMSAPSLGDDDSVDASDEIVSEEMNTDAHALAPRPISVPPMPAEEEPLPPMTLPPLTTPPLSLANLPSFGDFSAGGAPVDSALQPHPRIERIDAGDPSGETPSMERAWQRLPSSPFSAPPLTPGFKDADPKDADRKDAGPSSPSAQAGPKDGGLEDALARLPDRDRDSDEPVETTKKGPHAGVFTALDSVEGTSEQPKKESRKDKRNRKKRERTMSKKAPAPSDPRAAKPAPKSAPPMSAPAKNGAASDEGPTSDDGAPSTIRAAMVAAASSAPPVASALSSPKSALDPQLEDESSLAGVSLRLAHSAAADDAATARPSAALSEPTVDDLKHGSDEPTTDARARGDLAGTREHATRRVRDERPQTLEPPSSEPAPAEHLNDPTAGAVANPEHARLSDISSASAAVAAARILVDDVSASSPRPASEDDDVEHTPKKPSILRGHSLSAPIEESTGLTPSVEQHATLEAMPPLHVPPLSMPGMDASSTLQRALMALESSDADECARAAVLLAVEEPGDGRVLRLAARAMTLSAATGQMPKSAVDLFVAQAPKAGERAASLAVEILGKVPSATRRAYTHVWIAGAKAAGLDVARVMDLLRDIAVVDAPSGPAFELAERVLVEVNDAAARDSLYQAALKASTAEPVRVELSKRRLGLLENQSRFAEALPLHAQLAVELASADVAVRAAARRAFAQHGTPDERARFLGRLARKLPGDEGLEVVQELLDVRLSVDDRLGAEAAAKDLLERRPGDPRACKVIADLLEDEPHRLDELVDVLRVGSQHALSYFGKTGEARTLLERLASVQEKAGRPEDAADAWVQVARLVPDEKNLERALAAL